MEGRRLVGRRDDDRTRLGHQSRGDGADIAKALDGDARALETHPQRRERLARHDHTAATGCLAPPQGAAHLDRFPRHHRGHGVAFVHGVGVHDPRHHALVRVYIGCRDVRIGAQDFDDAGGVASRHTLQLAHRHRGRIANDAALGAPERDVHQRALPRHPGGQRFDFFEGDVEIEANAALGRSTRRVVQHAVAGIDLDLSAVAEDRHGDNDLFFGIAQNLVQAGVEIEQLRRVIEALHHRFERIFLGEEGLFVRSDNRRFAHTARFTTPSRTRSTASPFNSQRTASPATSGSGASFGQRRRSFTASFSVTTT